MPCEPLTKRKKSGKLTTPSPKRCKNSNDSSILKVDEDDTETFLLHSSLVATVHSSPSSPSSDTLSPLNGTRIETDDIEETILIDSEGDETEEEDVEEVEGGDEQINVGMFENITDLVVESVRKGCSGDEVMSTKINKIRDALKNERHEHMLLVERYERDLKTSADDLRAVKSENETVTSKLESTNGRLLERSKETFKLLNDLMQLRFDHSELERLNNEMKLNLSNTNSTMQNVTDRELALNERVLELQASVNALTQERAQTEIETNRRIGDALKKYRDTVKQVQKSQYKVLLKSFYQQAMKSFE